MAKAPALGRGLGALIAPKAKVAKEATPVAAVDEGGERVRVLPIGKVIPSPLQPRTEFREEHLTELIESIRERGILQPLIVRKVGETYELIAGERRWRAARQVGLTEVPTLIREASDREVLELALIENLQREDLNPMEEAAAYARLSKEFSMTQEEIARRVGKSRAAVANAVRLLDLDGELQGYLRTGRISVGHAKVLLSLKTPEEQRLLAEQILRQGASVRAAEQLVSKHLAKTGRPVSESRNGKSGVGRGQTSAAVKRVENLLQHRLATRVVINHGEKTGSISIEYYGSDDLNRILGELGVQLE